MYCTFLYKRIGSHTTHTHISWKDHFAHVYLIQLSRLIPVPAQLTMFAYTSHHHMFVYRSTNQTRSF